jgi:hypothetical protein
MDESGNNSDVLYSNSIGLTRYEYVYLDAIIYINKADYISWKMSRERTKLLMIATCLQTEASSKIILDNHKEVEESLHKKYIAPLEFVYYLAAIYNAKEKYDTLSKFHRKLDNGTEIGHLVIGINANSIKTLQEQSEKKISLNELTKYLPIREKSKSMIEPIMLLFNKPNSKNE